MRERKGIRQRVAELRIIPWVLLSLPPFLECLDIELVISLAEGRSGRSATSDLLSGKSFENVPTSTASHASRAIASFPCSMFFIAAPLCSPYSALAYRGTGDPVPRS